MKNLYIPQKRIHRLSDPFLKAVEKNLKKGKHRIDDVRLEVYEDIIYDSTFYYGLNGFLGLRRFNEVEHKDIYFFMVGNLFLYSRGLEKKAIESRTIELIKNFKKLIEKFEKNKIILEKKKFFGNYEYDKYDFKNKIYTKIEGFSLNEYGYFEKLNIAVENIWQHDEIAMGSLKFELKFIFINEIKNLIKFNDYGFDGLLY